MPVSNNLGKLFPSFIFFMILGSSIIEQKHIFNNGCLNIS